MRRRRNRLVLGVRCLVFGAIPNTQYPIRDTQYEIVGCVVFLAVLCFPLTGCFSQNQGIIKDEQKAKEDIYTHDFGKVKEGEVVKHSFEFKNETKNILNIKEVNSSCGCTSSEVKKKKLLPGESTYIDIKFNSKGYSDQRQVTQYIYVNTDDIDNPIVRYIITILVVK